MLSDAGTSAPRAARLAAAVASARGGGGGGGGAAAVGDNAFEAPERGAHGASQSAVSVGNVSGSFSP